MKSLLAAALLASVLAVQPAFAHAFLKTATPAVGSTVAQPPGQVVIDFTEGVEPQFSTIAVQDAGGADVAAGGVHLVGGNTHLAVPLKPLKPGAYKVVWHATAVDTHKTEGSFTFTVAQ
jgi:methionine-rich copper-binding protein CopC